MKKKILSVIIITLIMCNLYFVSGDKFYMSNENNNDCSNETNLLERKNWSKEELQKFKKNLKNKTNYENIEKGVVIVKFMDEKNKNKVIKDIKDSLKMTILEEHKYLDIIDAYTYTFDENEVKIKELVKELNDHLLIEYAEPNQLGYLQSSRTITYTLESPHNYPRNYNDVWNIWMPGASKIRVHFSRIDTGNNDYVFTGAGDRWSGSLSNRWSGWANQSSIRVRLQASSSSNGGWGFRTDKIEYELGGNINPNDTRYSEQWALPYINAIPAWSRLADGHGIIVGVIDTGIDTSHPDLTENIAYNFNEIPNNNRDDDRNGKIDDYLGWNFISNNNIVYDTSNDPINVDPNGHGTHIAGIIAASGNNGRGIIGLAHNAKILPLKCGGDRMVVGFPTSAVVEAISYARSRGVRIINMSFEQNYSQSVRDAMNAASEILFVCSANNRTVGVDVSLSPVYPACYGLSNIISVANVDRNGNLAVSSNYGTNIDIAAPGENILSTLPDNRYGMSSGTSQAAAYVSGLAAIILSQDSSLTPIQVKTRITSNYRSINSLRGKLRYPGVVDAEKATFPVNNGDDFIKGDINGDGVIDSVDYVLIRRFILSIIDEFPNGQNGFRAADINNDGRVDSADMVLLRRYLLGIINKLP
ncbi:UNVERIFIED_CONTAM: subtilisin family serine protease [Acetivibrio alkalicellulosi]